jgi:ABC-2 type transport system permease protein
MPPTEAVAVSPTLVPRSLGGRGWRLGLSNLLAAGFGAWWRTNQWWTQVLIWVAVTNLPVAAVVAADPGLDEIAPATIYSVMSMFAAVAVAIIMMEQIVGEKRQGTAAWILSKPVSRSAFVLAKLIPNAIGVLATMVLVPGAVAYLQLSLAGIALDPLGFLAGLAVIGLELLFFLTLTLMLGTVFASAGPVVGIALAFAFGQQFLAATPIAPFLPWALVVPLEGGSLSSASALMLGQPIPAPAAILVTAVACVGFVVLAIWRFERTEL